MKNNKSPVTVKELIEFLKDAPQDAVVQVLAENCKSYQCSTQWITLSLPEEPDGLTDSYYNMSNKFIQLGQE